MIVDVSKKVLIVGLGLLGGSYARALKRFGFHISAITLDQSSIDYAIGEGIIDEGSIDLDERMIGEADLVIFALYPHVFVDWIERNQGLLKSGALITDVVRCPVWRTVRRTCSSERIISSPLHRRIRQTRYRHVWS